MTTHRFVHIVRTYDGLFTAKTQQGNLPGVYDSLETAFHAATQVPAENLLSIWEEVVQGASAITMQDL